jgi:hypothetical protein
VLGDKNWREIKCNGDDDHGLLTENQYDLDPLSELSC